MKKILLALLIIPSLYLGAQEQDSIFIDSSDNSSQFVSEETVQQVTKTEADSAYINNDFVSAIALYEYLLENKGESPDIYYNLGNSYYKSDHIAKAILNYERALLLKPGDQDIRFNLELAQSKTVDKINIPGDIFFISWYRSIINIMGVDGWAKVSIILFIIFLVAMVAYIFSKQLIIKKIGFSVGVLFFLFTIVTNIFAWSQKDSLVNRTSAIIISPSVTVKSTPNQSGTDLFILHEGHKVSIKDNSMREWKEIQLEDGNVGWVPAGVIEVI